MAKVQRIGWMWYPGDMEIYHCMLQNFSREERGYGWPAYWHMDDWNKNVFFSRSYELMEETSFTAYTAGVGHVLVNGTLEMQLHRIKTVTACYGESDLEAMDGKWRPAGGDTRQRHRRGAGTA